MGPALSITQLSSALANYKLNSTFQYNTSLLNAAGFSNVTSDYTVNYILHPPDINGDGEIYGNIMGLTKLNLIYVASFYGASLAEPINTSSLLVFASLCPNDSRFYAGPTCLSSQWGTNPLPNYVDSITNALVIVVEALGSVNINGVIPADVANYFNFTYLAPEYADKYVIEFVAKNGTGIIISGFITLAGMSSPICWTFGISAPLSGTRSFYLNKWTQDGGWEVCLGSPGGYQITSNQCTAGNLPINTYPLELQYPI